MKLGKFNSKGSLVLGVIGMIGVTVTAIMAAVDTIKLADKIDDFEYKGTPMVDMSKKEVAVILVDNYKATIASGIITTLCVFGSCFTYSKTNKQLLTTLALSDDLINRTKKLAGETLNSKDILNKSEKKDITPEEPIDIPNNRNDIFTVNEYYKGAELFYDCETDMWFYATEMDILNAAYHFNRNFCLAGCRSLGEFYEFLGLDAYIDSDVNEKGFSQDWFFESGLAPWIDIWWNDDIIENMHYKKLYFAWGPIKCYEEWTPEDYEYPRE